MFSKGDVLLIFTFGGIKQINRFLVEIQTEKSVYGYLNDDPCPFWISKTDVSAKICSYGSIVFIKNEKMAYISHVDHKLHVHGTELFQYSLSELDCTRCFLPNSLVAFVLPTSAAKTRVGVFVRAGSVQQLVDKMSPEELKKIKKFGNPTDVCAHVTCQKLEILIPVGWLTEQLAADHSLISIFLSDESRIALPESPRVAVLLKILRRTSTLVIQLDTGQETISLVNFVREIASLNSLVLVNLRGSQLSCVYRGPSPDGIVVVLPGHSEETTEIPLRKWEQALLFCGTELDEGGFFVSAIGNQVIISQKEEDSLLPCNRVRNSVLTRPEYSGFLPDPRNKGLYYDGGFVPRRQSVGPHNQLNGVFGWRRLCECYPGMRIIRDGIHPNDINQGGIGDCWLLSAFASLAEFPEIFDNIFLSYEVSPFGIYAFRVHDMATGKKVVIGIDDYIPVRFQPNSDAFSSAGHRIYQGEIWVALLEKLFAKIVGSYSNLIAGNSMFAVVWLTGSQNLLQIQRISSTWKISKIFFEDSRSPRSLKTKEFGNLKEIHGSHLWKQLVHATKMCFLTTASGTSPPEDCGIVRAHAYSLLKVRSIHGYNLVCLRNPHGFGGIEWNGAFSDTWKGWDSHPSIYSELKITVAKDGIFWMPFKDFVSVFDKIIMSCQPLKPEFSGSFDLWYISKTPTNSSQGSNEGSLDF